MSLLNPIELVGRSVSLGVSAVKLATYVPRTALELLVNRGQAEDRDPFAAARVVEQEERTTARTPTGPSGRRAPSPAATPGRATADAAVETTASPPEPTSAAGASGGVAGTAAAPGAAAAAGAPDPTVPRVRRGQRRQRDVQPNGAPRRKSAEPEETLVETEGSAAPGAQLRVDAPWDGYDRMKANEIVTRVKRADVAAKAVVRLYEQTHKKRKSILDATAS
jgi:hypothetical protein